jgi:hypothetical protein
MNAETQLQFPQFLGTEVSGVRSLTFAAQGQGAAAVGADTGGEAGFSEDAVAHAQAERAGCFEAQSHGQGDA